MRKEMLNKNLKTVFFIIILVNISFSPIVSSNVLINSDDDNNQKKQLNLLSTNNNIDLLTEHKPINFLLFHIFINLLKSHFISFSEVISQFQKLLVIFDQLPNIICEILIILMIPIFDKLYELSMHPDYFISFYARWLYDLLYSILDAICYPIFPLYFSFIHGKATFSELLNSYKQYSCDCMKNINV